MLRTTLFVLAATLAVSAEASAGNKKLGRSCNNNNDCQSRTCDAGWGTSQTNTCVPADGTGKTDDYCTNHRNCRSKSCSGHDRPPRHRGVCRGLRSVKLGRSCAHDDDCQSRTCDIGNGTSKTALCVPKDGKGNGGDFCTNHRNCRSKLCSGHTRPGHRGVCLERFSIALGESCQGNDECQSRACDLGWGTSKTGLCVPNRNASNGTFCTNHAQCRSGFCTGHAGARPGECKALTAVGERCRQNSDCQSGSCDAGNGTSKTNRCVHPKGRGREGAYCSHDHQCRTSHCKGLAPKSDGSWTPGKCAPKVGLGADCGNDGHCGWGLVCDPVERCVHPNARGGADDFCTNDNQCRSAHCAGVLTRDTGTCGPKVATVGSYVDKTRVWIRNNTNQWLVLSNVEKSGPRLPFGRGRHFFLRDHPERVRRYGTTSPRRYALQDKNGAMVVPPGELVEVLWFNRAGTSNGANYVFSTHVSMTTPTGTARVTLQQKVTGQVVGSGLFFRVQGDSWRSGTKHHERVWNASQRIRIRYRGLQRPGIGGDVEYAFIGPDPQVKLSFPVHPRGRVGTGGIMGPARMDHNPFPRLNIAACSDFRGYGNATAQGATVNCYGGHEGSDFSLSGGFATMKNKKTYAVAAADGVVVRVVDGNFDKCGLNFRSIDGVDQFLRVLDKLSCKGGANLVRIDHGHGIETAYLHLKKNTVRVAEKQTVKCGQILGEIGSSGKSLTPHLHLDVIDNGAHVDPFEGPQTNRGYWVRQQDDQPLPATTCPISQ